MHARLIVLLLCWGLLAGRVAPACAQADSAGYEALVDEGVREFSAGNFVEARSLFERAHALLPNARTFRALGLCSFELKHYVQAEDELSQALADTRNALTEELMEGVQRTLERARGFVGELALQTRPEDSRLLIDGLEREGRSFRLDAGEHLLTASAPGYHSRDLRLSISGLQKRTLELVVTPVQMDLVSTPVEPGVTAVSAPSRVDAEPGLTQRWWFWTAIGVVAVGALTATLVVATQGGDVKPSSTTGVTLHGSERHAALLP